MKMERLQLVCKYGSEFKRSGGGHHKRRFEPFSCDVTLPPFPLEAVLSFAKVLLKAYGEFSKSLATKSIFLN